MAKVNFDDHADQYEGKLKEQLQFFDNSDYFSEYKIKIIREHVADEPKTILEYGCGIGKNLPFLKKLFPESIIYGYDISKKSLHIAAQNNPTVNFTFNDMPKNIDLIVIAGVLHHIAPPERNNVIRDIYQSITPGGKLFIFEHNPYNPITRHLVNTCIFDKDAVLITAKKLKFLLKNHGFMISKTRYTLFLPSWLKKLRILERHLGFLPLGGQYFIYAKKPPL